MSMSVYGRGGMEKFDRRTLTATGEDRGRKKVSRCTRIIPRTVEV
jgi:hypothetical protein